MLFRLRNRILVFTETVPVAPCHVMSGKHFGHGYVIDIEDISVTLYATGLLQIPVRDTETAAFIVNEAIERDLPFRAQIVGKFDRFFEDRGTLHTKISMLLYRNTVHSAVVNIVLVVTPPDRLVVKVGQLCKNTARHEILFYKANQALYSLCEHSDKMFYPQTFFIRTFGCNAY